MAQRNLLHKDDLLDFVGWSRLHATGYVTEWPTGAQYKNWQRFRLRNEETNVMHVIYARSDMPEHLTIPVGLIALIRQYIRQKKVKERNEQTPQTDTPRQQENQEVQLST